MQAYRSLHVTIQSILLAVGVGLTVASLTIADYPNFLPAVLVSATLLTCIAGLHLFSARKFAGVVLARGEDINWWHFELIRKEHSLSPDARYFTRFKIHQQARRKDVTHLEAIFISGSQCSPLTNEQITELIGKGLGHTRKVIDQQLFAWIERIWWLLFFVAWSGPAVAFFKQCLRPVLQGSA